jgi:hypothetical protein
MIDDPLTAPTHRPLWLVTLADLALLLLGFVVLVQATANREPLAQSLRARFGAPEPIQAVAAAAVDFAPGSAVPRNMARVVAWTRDALRDPRVTVTVTGSAAPGEAGGVLLAADRGRAVAAALVGAGFPADRLQLATSPAGGARAILTIAFTGQPRSQA